jgi:hypothetical protein
VGVAPHAAPLHSCKYRWWLAPASRKPSVPTTRVPSRIACERRMANAILARQPDDRWVPLAYLHHAVILAALKVGSGTPDGSSGCAVFMHGPQDRPSTRVAGQRPIPPELWYPATDACRVQDIDDTDVDEGLTLLSPAREQIRRTKHRSGSHVTHFRSDGDRAGDVREQSCSAKTPGPSSYMPSPP